MLGAAETTAERARRLVASGAIPQQQSDDARALANSAMAAVATRKA